MIFKMIDREINKYKDTRLLGRFAPIFYFISKHFLIENSVKQNKKIELDRFRRSDVYWTQTDRPTNRQTSKVHICIDVFRLKSYLEYYY